ncbi:MAG: flagellar motor switch protein FliM [Planctomycetota bacterium]|jgi:flagellar motor switch protein FliM
MPDILSQNEVDALLAAVDEGDFEVAPQASEPSPISASNAEVAIYDFKRPERVSTDQIRSMEMQHEVLARKLAASLSAYLRTIIDVRMASVEQLTYQEFIMSLPNPTCFNLMSCNPLDGQMVLEVNPSIVFPIIDKLLGGGSSDVSIPEREMTTIEQRLINRITEMVLEFLHEIWRTILNIEFKITATESNPQLMQIVPPNEVVILICFEIRMGECSGMLNLCIPFPVIEPVMSKLSTINTWFSYRKAGSEEESFDRMNEGIESAGLNSIAYIAETKISMRQFLNLKPGDVLRTQKEAKNPMLLKINGKPKFLGRPGSYRGQKAMRIEKVSRINESINS